MGILNQNAYEEKSKTGYGIWLSFLLIIMNIGSFRAIVHLIKYSEAYDLLTTGYVIVLFSISLVSTVGFFNRKRWTTYLFISFFVMNLLYILYSNLALTLTTPGSTDYFALVRILVICTLAIPYLLHSKRVKEVFIR